ncbi:MAG: flagellar export protein FliJ [Candidatus Marinimicrobia bacterium]|nr:flagellar export protein FliJ [Candidatus Neomarinimicrobiota bacterium]
MKVYRFPYQKILDVRKALEKNKKVELKNRLVELEHEKEKLRYLESEKEGTFGITEDNSITDLRIKADYIHQLNDMIDKQLERIADFSRRVDETRKELIEVNKEKKIMERLEESHRLEYTKNQRKEELKLNSEIALRKFRNLETGE